MLTISFVLLVFAIFVSLAALICNAVLPSALRALDLVSPASRSQLLLLAAAAPWLIGASLIVSSVGDILFGACDFGTTCLWNEDIGNVNPIRTLIVIPLVATTGILILRVLRQYFLSRGILATLERLAMQDHSDVAGDGDATRVVPSDVALAFAGKGRIYVSHSLRDQLPPELYRAVLLHEQAHIKRRDGLVQAIAHILMATYIPPFRTRLLNALALANEQACDEYAASVVGRTHVASAILAVERMSRGTQKLPHPGFADSFVALRVHRLMGMDSAPLNIGRFKTVIVLAILLAFLAGDVLYYLAMMILYPKL